MDAAALTFGPVPSRRLGRSLGINNIPPKTCSYGCVYCQVGRTTRMLIGRQAFFAPELILRKVREKVRRLTAAAGRLDFITIVPDGEPTLDINLGRTIRPPAESWVRPTDEEGLHRAYRLFTAVLPAVELLVTFEGGDFNATDEAGAELLAITAVHPMREDAALAFLEKAGKSAATLEELLQRGLLTRLRYRDAWFYLRRFSR